MDERDRIIVKITKDRLREHPSVKIAGLIKIIECLDAENEKSEDEFAKLMTAQIKEVEDNIRTLNELASLKSQLQKMQALLERFVETFGDPQIRYHLHKKTVELIEKSEALLKEAKEV